jgi:uncharacterized protein (UPF0335 family)
MKTMTPPPSNHNSEVIAGKKLKSYIDRIEKLIEDRKAVSEDIKEVKQEAKGNGFDLKTINEVIKLRALDAEKRREQEELRDLYLSALGMC